MGRSELRIKLTYQEIENCGTSYYSPYESCKNLICDYCRISVCIYYEQSSNIQEPDRYETVSNYISSSYLTSSSLHIEFLPSFINLV